MANKVTLQSEENPFPLDENLRPLKIGDKSSSIELSQHHNGSGARVTGELKANSLNISGGLGTLLVDNNANLILSNGGKVIFGDAGEYIAGDGTDLDIFSSGDINLKSADVIIDATRRLYLDGGGDTFISESTADSVKYIVGGDAVMVLSESGNDGNLVNIGTSCAGFSQHEPTFDAADTLCYFNRSGNKASLTFDGDNITDIHLVFPNISCNCVLLVTQDGTGSRTITNWKTFDQAGGNESTVKFAGGSNPTLTTTADKTDIISFYWDNDNHRAYGVASLNF